MENFLTFPNENLLQMIKKDLNENTKFLEKQVTIFKIWLKNESNLPTDIDENFIRKILRSCKYNLEKSKERFEKYLSLRIQLKPYYTWDFDENFFKTPVHRHLYLCPEMTSEGDHVLIYRVPRNSDDYLFKIVLRYYLFLVDYLLFETTFANFIFICDTKDITIYHIAKTNIVDALRIIDLVFNKSPLRVKQVHFLNLRRVAKFLVDLAIKTMNEDLQQRVQIHSKDDDILKILPKHFVPKDYDGDGMSFSENGDLLERYFMQNQNWIKESKKLLLTGPTPSNKKDLCPFEEEEAGSSLKKLSID